MPRKKVDSYEIEESENNVDVVFIPDVDDSGESGDDESDDESHMDECSGTESEIPFTTRSYAKKHEEYNNSQRKLEENHEYVWLSGEQIYENALTNEILLSDSDKNAISNRSHKEIFEFFSLLS